MRCYNPDELTVAFDDERLVADAGLLLPATLAVGLGLRQLLDAHVDLGEAPGRANAADKAMTLLHSALAGGSWIDDCDRLRAGSTGSVLGHRVLAPSTIGTFLRSFTFGHARQLDAVSGQALQRAWQAGAGPDAAPLTIDVDSTICEVYGVNKQGAEFGHTKVRGYHPLLAFAAGTWDLLHSRLRGGSAYTARGAAGFVAETIGRVRAAGATGPLTLRADSGFYARTVVAACQRHGVLFSITAKLTKAVRRAIQQLPADAWIPIAYWLEDAADVAETSYRPFGKKGPPTRLIVRRVRPTPAASSPCSPPTTTTRSSPTGPAAPWRWRPTTAATPRSNPPSATSREARAWCTCPRAALAPTPPGWPCAGSPTTWPAGPRD